jgi:choline dehydrogenase-like flavoprotein
MSKGSVIHPFDAAEVDCLQAAFDVAIPIDEWPGGWEGGVGRLLLEHTSDLMNWAVEPLRMSVRLLNDGAKVHSQTEFAQLSEEDRLSVFEGVMASGSEAKRALESLLSVAFDGFYGGTSEPTGWKMVGFQPLPSAVQGMDPDPLAGITPHELRDHYDVIVIGAGAGGGVAAAELAARGQQVLIVERARAHRDSELRGNHLQGKRQQLFDVTAGPGRGSPRVRENGDGSTDLLAGEGGGLEYGLVAMAAGGGTRLWQGMAWRFYEEDFEMASRYGVPADSTLADWPFGYDELERFYDRVEWELGVSGDDGSLTRRTHRSRGYPMPPLPGDRIREIYSAAASRIGISASSIPFAINSQPRDGRAACVRCAQCVGHACPVDAKNGTHNTFIPRALASGNCDLLMSAQALNIDHDSGERASAVELVIDLPGGPVRRTIRCSKVVVSAGAVETPRLLLASSLGNEWVGRNHHSHGTAVAVAFSGNSVKTYEGPGHSVASVDWVHRDGEAWGGGVMFDLPPDYPLARAEIGRRLPGYAFGRAHKEWMKHTQPFMGALSMVQEIPHALSRVSLDPNVRDKWGMPVARLRGEGHWASQEASDYMAKHCSDWVAAAGGTELQTYASPGGWPNEHSAGTVRMGTDPAAAACDENGKLFGTTNVFVADASLHPTNGGFNPGLTVMANAMRVASRIE